MQLQNGKFAAKIVWNKKLQQGGHWDSKIILQTILYTEKLGCYQLYIPSIVCFANVVVSVTNSVKFMCEFLTLHQP